MAKKLTSGQITITDLNDGRVLSKYTNASQGYTQIYDTENKTYSVNYTTTPQVITASVYASGTNTNDQAPTSACSGWKWYVNGTQVTSSTTNMTAAANKLTIKQNMNKDNLKTMTIRWECTFHDDITGTDVVVTDGCTLNLTTSGTSAAYVDILTPKGTIFDGGKTNLDKLQIVARLMRGAQIDTTNLTFKWSKLTVGADGTLTWTAIASGFKTANGTSTLEVSRDDVDGSQTFQVEIEDTVLKDKFQGFCTVLDKLDEYNVVLVAPQGTAIKNGQGSVTVTAQVYKNNEVMADTTGLTFTWYKYDKTGKQVNWSGTGTPATKTGNPITVTAADVNVTTTIVCEVDQG